MFRAQICHKYQNLSCGEISDFCKEFEQFMEFYRNLCLFCSKFVWRQFCVEKKWQIWGLFISNKFNQFFPPTHRSFSSPVFSPFCVCLQSVFFFNTSDFFPICVFLQCCLLNFSAPLLRTIGQERGGALRPRHLFQVNSHICLLPCSSLSSSSSFSASPLWPCVFVLLCPLLSLVQEYDCAISMCAISIHAKNSLSNAIQCKLDWWLKLIYYRRPTTVHFELSRVELGLATSSTLCQKFDKSGVGAS